MKPTASKMVAVAAIMALGAMFMSTVSSDAAPKQGVAKSVFGKTGDGAEVDLYTLTNKNGVVAKITNYGAILTELHVPDRNGKLGNVVFGFDNLEGYLKGHPYFGSTVGRVANRIAKGKFTLEGKEYTLAVNNGPNSLHGGLKGFDKAVWKASLVKSGDGPSVKFTHHSPDMDEGYPGAVDVTVVYTLTNKNSVRIEYSATTTKPTPINLTNHSYFNLRGSGDVLGYEMQINADNYTPVDDTLIPTGVIAPVKGTPLDFTFPHPIGEHMKELGGEPNGYDHNFVINGGGKALTFTARCHDPISGRTVEMQTTEPGVQFYTGNFLDGTLTGVGGFNYQIHDAFCLEAQHYPDSINHANFPSSVLRPGQHYHQVTEYTFTAK
jgi:aldose 1-epimerase